MDWGAAAALGSAGLGALGGYLGTQGGVPEEKDPERKMRRWISSASARQIFGPGTEWDLPPGAVPPTMPTMDYEAAVSGSHPLQNYAIDMAQQTPMGVQYGQDVYGQMQGYSDAAMQSSAGALGNAYSQLMAGYDIDPSTLAQQGAEFAANPYLDQVINAAVRPVYDQKRNTMLAANAAGNLGSGSNANAQALLDARIAEIGAGIKSDAYTQGVQNALQTELANQRAGLAATGQLGAMGQNLAGLAGDYAGLGLRGAELAQQAEQAQIEQLRQMGMDEREIEQQLLQSRAMNDYMQAMAPYRALEWMQGQYMGGPGAGTPGQNPWSTAMTGAGLGLDLWKQWSKTRKSGGSDA